MPPSTQGGVGLELVLRTVANSSKVIKCQQFSPEKKRGTCRLTQFPL